MILQESAIVSFRYGEHHSPACVLSGWSVRWCRLLWYTGFFRARPRSQKL